MSGLRLVGGRRCTGRRVGMRRGEGGGRRRSSSSDRWGSGRRRRRYVTALCLPVFSTLGICKCQSRYVRLAGAGAPYILAIKTRGPLLLSVPVALVVAATIRARAKRGSSHAVGTYIGRSAPVLLLMRCGGRWGGGG
jgi:hypothetical protein